MTIGPLTVLHVPSCWGKETCSLYQTGTKVTIDEEKAAPARVHQASYGLTSI
jgi:hypothetical protein